MHSTFCLDLDLLMFGHWVPRAFWYKQPVSPAAVWSEVNLFAQMVLISCEKMHLLCSVLRQGLLYPG